MRRGTRIRPIRVDKQPLTKEEATGWARDLMFDGLPELLEAFKEVTRARKQNSGGNGRESAGQEEGLPVRRIFLLSFPPP